MSDNNNKTEKKMNISSKPKKNVYFSWSTEKINNLNFRARVTKNTVHAEPQSNGRYVTSEIIWGMSAYPTRARAKANAISRKRFFTKEHQQQQQH